MICSTLKAKNRQRSHKLSHGTRTRRTACRRKPAAQRASRAGTRRNVLAKRERAEEVEAVEQSRTKRRHQTSGPVRLTCARIVRQSDKEHPGKKRKIHAHQSEETLRKAPIRRQSAQRDTQLKWQGESIQQRCGFFDVHPCCFLLRPTPALAGNCQGHALHERLRGSATTQGEERNCR